MDLDDLIWELNEEQKRCAEGAKNRSGMAKTRKEIHET